MGAYCPHRQGSRRRRTSKGVRDHGVGESELSKRKRRTAAIQEQRGVGINVENLMRAVRRGLKQQTRQETYRRKKNEAYAQGDERHDVQEPDAEIDPKADDPARP